MGKWEVGCLKDCRDCSKMSSRQEITFLTSKDTLPRKTKASNLSHKKHKLKKKNGEGHQT